MFTIRAHCSPLELEIVDKGKNYLIKKLFTIGAHWSPLELEIVDEGKSSLIKKCHTIGAHWSPLELENSDWIIIFWKQWCLPLEPIGVH